MNDTSIPGIPFGGPAPRQGSMLFGPIDIVSAGEARGVAENAERELERSERDQADARAQEASLSADYERQAVDYYDGVAKVERSRGNRKFVRHFAIGAGVTIAAILVIEALIAHAGSPE